MSLDIDHNKPRLILQDDASSGPSSVIGYYYLVDENYVEENRLDWETLPYYGDVQPIIETLKLQGFETGHSLEEPQYIDVSILDKPVNPTEVNLVWDSGTFSFDVPPQVVSGRTMVPLRALFESFGYEINWLGEINTVQVIKGDITAYLEIGTDFLDIYNYATGENSMIIMDVPAQVIDGRTLVPLRFISEFAGLEVEWYGENRTVLLKGSLTE